MFFSTLIQLSGLEAMGPGSNPFKFAELIRLLRIAWWVVVRNSSFHIISFKSLQTFPSKSTN